MIDVILLGVIGLSTLLGFFRGFVGIVVGTLSWLLAGFAAFQFGPAAGAWFAAPAQADGTHVAGGYVAVFIATMVVVSVIGMLLRTGLRMTLLGGIDRMLGGGLGVLRGGFFAAVLLLIGGLTPLREVPAWRSSHVRVGLQPVVGWMESKVPAVPSFDMPKDITPASLPGAQPGALDGLLPNASAHAGSAMDLLRALPMPGSGNGQPADLLGKPAATGDNGVLGEVVAERGWPRDVEPARGAAGERANAPALPANIESAPRRPDPAAVP